MAPRGQKGGRLLHWLSTWPQLSDLQRNKAQRKILLVAQESRWWTRRGARQIASPKVALCGRTPIHLPSNSARRGVKLANPKTCQTQLRRRGNKRPNWTIKTVKRRRRRGNKRPNWTIKTVKRRRRRGNKRPNWTIKTVRRRRRRGNKRPNWTIKTVKRRRRRGNERPNWTIKTVRRRRRRGNERPNWTIKTVKRRRRVGQKQMVALHWCSRHWGSRETV
jgi:hypothetical protein